MLGTSGIENMESTLRDARINEPPIPPEMRDRVKRVGDWAWSTRPINPTRMYMFGDYIIESLAKPVPQYFALSHAGHGVNSYSLNYFLLSPPLHIFLQVAWGGIYTRNEDQIAEINGRFRLLDSILHEAEGMDHRPRLVVVQSRFRDMDVCSWLPEKLSDEGAAYEWLRAENRKDADALADALGVLREARDVD